ncbi:hypothetical protein DFJ77DRAFT_440760 [Powellomyces hirtus]|nr:hypothetical protein DFJ77DRAFT_440760 [Powellomyces hirtus]
MTTPQPPNPGSSNPVTQAVRPPPTATKTSRKVKNVWHYYEPKPAKKALPAPKPFPIQALLLPRIVPAGSTSMLPLRLPPTPQNMLQFANPNTAFQPGFGGFALPNTSVGPAAAPALGLQPHFGGFGPPRSPTLPLAVVPTLPLQRSPTPSGAVESDSDEEQENSEEDIVEIKRERDSEDDEEGAGAPKRVKTEGVVKDEPGIPSATYAPILASTPAGIAPALPASQTQQPSTQPPNLSVFFPNYLALAQHHMFIHTGGGRTPINPTAIPPPPPDSLLARLATAISAGDYQTAGALEYQAAGILAGFMAVATRMAASGATPQAEPSIPSVAAVKVEPNQTSSALTVTPKAEPPPPIPPLPIRDTPLYTNIPPPLLSSSPQHKQEVLDSSSVSIQAKEESVATAGATASLSQTSAKEEGWDPNLDLGKIKAEPRSDEDGDDDEDSTEENTQSPGWRTIKPEPR